MIRRIFTCLIAVMLCAVCMIPLKVGAASASSGAGVIVTAAGGLNVRKSASTGAAVVTSLRKGSYVTLIVRSGSWWQVEYAKNQFGYCHADYINQVSGSAVTVSTRSGGLNVRAGAGTSYAKLGSLYKGETVIELSSSGGWSRILYHGIKTGYVSSQYLSSGNGAVSLSVPSFKQTDSRWASVTIGGSGKTFSQIGCATTAIAMMESYRTGTTIYPHVMMEQLRYTASGSVYWPGNYVTVTNGSGYLSAIYNLLKQGKPVLFGAKNSYGKQHWVVITGYTGGSDLTASGFTINDPGTYSRTNLQQFLDLYPTFYKYFHY